MHNQWLVAVLKWRSWDFYVKIPIFKCWQPRTFFLNTQFIIISFFSFFFSFFSSSSTFSSTFSFSLSLSPSPSPFFLFFRSCSCSSLREKREEGQREERILSRPYAQWEAPSHDSEIMTWAEMKSQMLNQLNHPGTPTVCNLLWTGLFLVQGCLQKPLLVASTFFPCSLLTECFSPSLCSIGVTQNWAKCSYIFGSHIQIKYMYTQGFYIRKNFQLGW